MKKCKRIHKDLRCIIIENLFQNVDMLVMGIIIFLYYVKIMVMGLRNVELKIISKKRD